MGQQDLKISELVAKIERGEIKLPEMQRQYVWRKDRVRDLLDSLYRGYPSGTILTWESDSDTPTREFAIEQDDSARRDFQLLLDGQQRLTSLSAILRGAPVSVRDRKKPIDILFNLEHPEEIGEAATDLVDSADNGEYPEAEDDSDVTQTDFLHENVADASEDEILKRFENMAFVVYHKRLARLPQWVSVTEVFKESSNARFIERAGVTDMNDPRFHQYDTRLKRLRDIREYNYRVHILDRDKSYEEVTEIFVRVNSLGTKLLSSDLALAQITAKWRGSLQVFEEFEKECADDLGFDLGLAVHIRNLVTFATERSSFKSVGRLTKNKLEAAWKKSKEGMLFALNFLRSNVGIDSPAILASHFIAITVATYVDSKKYHLTPQEETALRYWALMANTKGRYSRGSSETLLDQDLAAIRRGQGIDELLRLLEAQVGRLSVEAGDLKDRNTNSAYFKAMFMAFKKDGAKDWRGQLNISLKHSGTQHKLQFHHIFPRAVLKKADIPQGKINDICNMAFIGGDTNRRIRDKEPAVYLREVVKRVGAEELEKQCIPTNPNLWEVGAYDEFLVERRQLVAGKLNQFLGHSRSI